MGAFAETDCVNACHGARAREVSGLPCLLLWFQQFITLLEDRVDGLRWAGVQAESAAFEAARWVEFVGWRGEPRAGGADRYAYGLVSAAVGMADEVITNDQHGRDSFKETLREDLEHVFLR